MSNPKRSIRSFFSKIYSDDLVTLSAALAYFAVLSLAPLSVALVIFWSFLSQDASSDLAKQVAQWLGQRAADAMMLVLDEARRPNFRAVAGVLTFLSLLVFGTAGFAQFQSSLDKIWSRKVEKISSWFIDRLIAVLLFFVVLGLLFLSFIVMAVIRLIEQQMDFALVSYFPVLAILFMGFALTAVYRWLSRGFIPWNAAFQGGVVAAVVFQLGQWVFEMYVKYASVGSAYGAAGTLVIFLVWIFFASFIVLIGAEWAYWAKRK